MGRHLKGDIVESLEKIVGKEYVVDERARIEDYLLDEAAEAVRPRPAANVVVVKPANAQDVSHILVFADENRIPVFPRGGGTGLVGGAVPTQDGIVLSLERLDKVEIDKENLMAVAEAGVTLQRLLATVDEASLFFPLHPGEETAQVGGLVATNAGGARAIKFGVMRNYVRGMEAVLASGGILQLGGKLQKNNTGYDLMNLIIGSEGTLAVITKVILRLYPKFEATSVMIVPYNSRHNALNSVPKVLQDGRMPLAIEYAERDLMERAAKHIGEVWPVKEGACYLIVMEAESSRDQILSDSLRIAEICKENGSLEPLLAEPKDEQDRILRVRSNIYSALQAETADILDVTVPPAEIGSLMDAVDEVARRYGAYLPTYGHAADGNLHVHLMKRDLANIEEMRDQIYRASVQLGGVITGEHGIGKARVEKLPQYLDKKQIDLMRKIKLVFDPNNILNPGTKIPI
jgi:glycolate oxidase